jgi:hypothetical protein
MENTKGQYLKVGHKPFPFLYVIHLQDEKELFQKGITA